ncbi:hypothetical protein ACE1OE_10990 [Vibrio sp. E150_011]
MANIDITTSTTSTPSNTKSHSDFLSIEVIDTNNYQTTQNNLKQLLSTVPHTDLKEYVCNMAQFNTDSEPSLFISVMNWVSMQWQHDGMNEPDKELSSLEILRNAHTNGQQYRCVEYGRVMTDVLASFGHSTRTVGLQAVDVAYGGFGKGHVVIEVWSNEQNKWLCFDPQFSVYAVRNEEILNVFDIYSLKKQGKESEVNFVVDPEIARLNNIERHDVTTNYWNFISKYLGYHVTSSTIGGSSKQLYLLMEANEPALTFQGMGGTTKRVFTKEPAVAYPLLNQTTISLVPLPSKSGSFQSICAKFDITTDEQYLSNMWRFAAEGEIALEFDSYMSNISNYQVRKNEGAWIDLTTNEHDWKLTIGKNRITVRAKSTENVLGPETYIEVSYR